MSGHKFKFGRFTADILLFEKNGYYRAWEMKNPIFYFWEYLKQNLAGKGGRRRGRLPFYLSEYVWQTNLGRLKPKQQIDHLLKLLFDLQRQRPKLQKGAKP